MNDEDLDFCDNCGNECEVCGADVFCEECGTPYDTPRHECSIGEAIATY